MLTWLQSAYHAPVDVTPMPPRSQEVSSSPIAPVPPSGPADREAPSSGRSGDLAEPPLGSDGLAATTEALDAVEAVLGAVEAALARLDAGTYGTCEVCRRPLADDLLAGHPTALRCEECAEESRLAIDGQPAD